MNQNRIRLVLSLMLGAGVAGGAVAEEAMEHEGSGYIESGTTATPPSHQDPGDRPRRGAEFDAVDRDDSDALSRQEWAEGIEPDYTQLDRDGDGMLSEQEYSAGLFRRYDLNQDLMLEREEYDVWRDRAPDEGAGDV